MTVFDRLEVCIEAKSILFYTERLAVRKILASDVDTIHAVYGDADAMRWVGNGQPLERSGCERWIEVTLQNYIKRGYGMYALVLRRSGEVLGFCGLVHPQNQPEAEIKYAILRPFWAQGYASEAAVGMLRFAELELGLKEVIATVAPENPASHRVLFKAGMVDVGLRTDDDGGFSRAFIWKSPRSSPTAGPAGGLPEVNS